MRSKGDNFIYDAVCDLHGYGNTNEMQHFDRWGHVSGPIGGARFNGVAYVNKPVLEIHSAMTGQVRLLEVALH